MLTNLLRHHPALTRQGLAIEPLSHCTVIIHRSNIAQGLWRASAGGYEFVPPGRDEPSHRASTLADVARLTEQLFEPWAGNAEGVRAQA